MLPSSLYFFFFHLDPPRRLPPLALIIPCFCSSSSSCRFDALHSSSSSIFFLALPSHCVVQGPRATAAAAAGCPALTAERPRLPRHVGFLPLLGSGTHGWPAPERLLSLFTHSSSSPKIPKPHPGPPTSRNPERRRQRDQKNPRLPRSHHLTPLGPVNIHCAAA